MKIKRPPNIPDCLEAMVEQANLRPKFLCMSKHKFFPASKWQKALIKRGVDHEALGTLPVVYLRPGESVTGRPLPALFADDTDEWPCLPLVEHRWRSLWSVCPKLTHSWLLARNEDYKLPDCPGCQVALQTVCSWLAYLVTKDGGLLVKLPMEIALELVKAGCFDFDTGFQVKIGNRNWEIYCHEYERDPVNEDEFRQLMEIAELKVNKRKPNFNALKQMAEAQRGWLRAGQPEPDERELWDLLTVLPNSTLIPIPWGCKAPHDPDWQIVSFRMMQDEDYLLKLTRGNVGLLCGRDEQAVRDGAIPNLITIGFDADDDECAADVLRLNPELDRTFTSYGARAPKWFFTLPGEMAHTLESTKIMRRENHKHIEVGDWLASGKQGVVLGLHPKGVFYRHNGQPMITLTKFKLPKHYYFASRVEKLQKRRRTSTVGAILDLKRLENVQTTAKGVESRCPACAQDGRDNAGDNLLIYADGRFKCAAYIGCSAAENHRHNQKIFALAGRKENHGE